ncbi:hypothetical protein [Paenibacillus lutrae]|uniref:hypothetical protein n=1 Tax=Paenibacillus lutrae TaxID=2078573 RepID=UPI001F222F88|nr:hypothetical protein [Paenibacillus lutrae]
MEGRLKLSERGTEGIIETITERLQADVRVAIGKDRQNMQELGQSFREIHPSVLLYT